VDQLKIQVQIAREQADRPNVCPVNIECQRRLKALLENNWVMENDSLRKSIIQLERDIASRGACTTTIPDEECASSKRKLSDEHEEQKRRLQADIKFLNEQITLSKQ